ncbi:unnamed protein product [Leptidea sinapis]|uniref:WAPL domain-containing protein n=1 Tax=Leptidea sinapis TaxID=189913 RepID=A0A5E4R522_9NEOP|nr:unnamed protein product [Leptidea sinapis]
MSRWGRGRSGSVAVPLDSALFRENSNCPTAARSAGTVGKWGITSFTSIRNAPYAYQQSAVKKPVQDQNSPLTVPAVETEQPPPKPKKFFKSRNTELYPPVPQITYAPPVHPTPLSPEHSTAKEKKPAKRSRHNRDSSSPELPRRNSEKSRGKKHTVTTKAAKKEDSSVENTQPPNKRYLVRNRDKVINYAEDGSNSPIPEFTRYEPLQPKTPATKASPLISPPSPKSEIKSEPSAKTEAASPSTSKDSNEERKPPPIVLRISKGTSRIVSTDSNEGFTSPGSDRHSSMDNHSDLGLDHKKSPSMEAICSPRQEGLKITIKCSSFIQETKKEKKKDKKDSHKHKKHHRISEDDLPLKRPCSPQPGSDAYDLYKTLASPIHEPEKKPEVHSKDKELDVIESQLAKLDSSVQESIEIKEPQPEPKPPESSRGRSRRNRPNINYNENDDDVYNIAVGISNKSVTKTVGDIKREARKTRRRPEIPLETALPAVISEEREGDKSTDAPLEHNDLITILSGDTKSDTIKLKVNKKQMHKIKLLSPSSEIVDNNVPDEVNVDNNERMEMQEAVENQLECDVLLQTHTPSSDSAYNSCPNELSEEEIQKQPQDVFKSPHSEENVEEKPSVKLVITKKKGSIFKSKQLGNDNNPSPLPARKRRHLYKHAWANEKGNETPRPEQAESTVAQNPVAEVSEELTRITRYGPNDDLISDTLSIDAVKPYTSVRCAKDAKEYYTVVRNVKKAHQIQEIGEFQEFNDDVEFLLDALQCTAPAFRMHLRAHGTVQKFFSALHDATNDQSLGLCTATVMFVLSQDRLNMDLDRESLELMLNLLEDALDDCGLTSAQLTKTQERVRELCAEIKNQGKAQHLDLDNITVGHLAMETLLSLTSKRAGEWFKEELRNLGGVDHIVRTIQDCAEKLQSPASSWTSVQIDILRKADRCMRVLENVLMLLINLVQNNDINTQRLLSVRIRIDNEHDIISRSVSALDLIAEAAIVAHVKSTQRIIQFMESCDKENGPVEQPKPAAPYTSTSNYNNYYQTSPSDVPQDMSLSSLNYMNYSTSSDRISSLEVDGYH